MQRLAKSVQALEDQVKVLTRIVLQQCKTVDDMNAQLNQLLNSGPSPPDAKAVPNRGRKQCASLDPKPMHKDNTSPNLTKRTPCSVEDDPDYRPTTHTSFFIFYFLLNLFGDFVKKMEASAVLYRSVSVRHDLDQKTNQPKPLLN